MKIEYQKPGGIDQSPDGTTQLPSGSGYGGAGGPEKVRKGEIEIKRIQDMNIDELKKFQEILKQAPKTEGNKRQLKKVETLIAKKKAGE